jgi:hypothetical protein
MTKEYLLQKECVKLFNLLYPNCYGLLFLNYNNPRNAKNGYYLKGIGLISGVADMTLLTKSGAVFIEFKTIKGKQSDLQKQWEQTITSYGYTYVIIRTPQQFLNLLKTHL